MKKIILSVTKEDESILSNINEQSKLKLVKKNNGKCSACGINITDYSYLHVEEGKIIPLCSLCYFPLHLDKVISKNPGNIILLPELSQIELNATLRAMEYIKIKKEDYIDFADDIDIIEVLLKERSDMADTYYSTGISNVSLLGQVLFSFDDNDYKQRELGLYGLRLMHNMKNHEKEMKSWDLELAKYKPETWKEMIKSFSLTQK